LITDRSSLFPKAVAFGHELNDSSGAAIPPFLPRHVRAAVDDLANVKSLREAVRKWLQRHGATLYDLGVREDAAVKGPHWHWLIHCPPHLCGEKLGQLGHNIRNVPAAARDQEWAGSHYKEIQARL
jgi:hypothetical protein